MAENLAWYAGQCVKRHDLNMTVKVIAMRSDSGWALLDNPQKLLPKTGEVEVRLATPSGHQPNSWVSFQISHKEPRGKWKASTYRNLMPFLDLQDIGSLDELRSLLTEEGIEGPDHAGVWVVRYSDDRVIMLNLMRYYDSARSRLSRATKSVVHHAARDTPLKRPHRSSSRTFHLATVTGRWFRWLFSSDAT